MTPPRCLIALFALLAGIGAGWVVPLTETVRGFVNARSSAPPRAGRRDMPPDEAKTTAGAKTTGNPTSAPPPTSSSPDELEAEFLRLWSDARKNGDKDIDRELMALMKLAAVDPYRAVTIAMKLDGPKASDLIAQLIRSMKTASQHALRALLENPKWQRDYGIVGAVFSPLAKIDPRMAWEEATKPGRSFGSMAEYEVGSEWAKKAPREGVAYAAGIVDREQSKQLAGTIFREWMKAKPGDFIAWLRDQTDRASWAELIPWGNMAANTREQFQALSALLPDKLPNPQFDGQSVFDGFFKKADMKDDYVAWIQAMPEGAARDAAGASLAKAMLGWNPDDALAMLPSVRDANVQTQITSAVAAWRATTNPQAGLAFAESLKDEAARTLALRSVVSTWAETDPAGAAGFIATRWDQLEGELFSVVSKWSEHDPQGAAAFALGQKVSGVTAGVAEKFDYGLRSAMGNWVKGDAYGASAWVLAMEPGLSRDIATDALAGAAMRVEPEGAIGWALTVSDPELRAKTLRDCVNTWSYSDPSRASAWVQSAPIDDELRKKLLGNIQATRKQRIGGSSSYSDKVIIY